MAFDSNAYKNGYRRDMYDAIQLMLPKGKKAIVQKCANAEGESLNKFIIGCIEKSTGLDLSKD